MLEFACNFASINTPDMHDLFNSKTSPTLYLHPSDQRTYYNQLYARLLKKNPTRELELNSDNIAGISGPHILK